MAPFIRPPCSETNSWGGSLIKKMHLHQSEDAEKSDQIYSPKSLIRSHASSPEGFIHYSHNSSEYSRSISISTSTSSSTSSRYAKADDLSETPAIQRVKSTSVNKETHLNNTLQRQNSKNGLQPTLLDMSHNPSGGDYPNTASLNSLISTLMCHYQPSVGVQEDKSRFRIDINDQGLFNQGTLVTSKWNETEKWVNKNADSPPIARNGSKSTHRDSVMSIEQERISLHTALNKVSSEMMQPICTSRTTVNTTSASVVAHNKVHRDALIDKVVTGNGNEGYISDLQHPVITNSHPSFENRDVNPKGKEFNRHNIQRRDDVPTQQRRPLAPTDATSRNEIGVRFPEKMHVKNADQQHHHHHHPSSNYMRDACTEISPSILCRRDMGTQMTPSGGSVNSSRRLTPPKRGGHKSPPRHNTPVKRSSMDSIAVMNSFQGSRERADGDQMQEQQLLGIRSFDPHWSPRADEDEDEIAIGSRGLHIEECYAKHDVLEARTNAWREATRLKVLARYEREELKIRAWEDHQAVKAEAELKKLQIKLERKRMQAAQKIVNKVEAAQRRAEVLRATARANEMQALESLAGGRAKKDVRSRLPLCACLTRFL